MREDAAGPEGLLRLHGIQPHWFANDLEEPYTTPEDKPFSWQGRLRVIGGRTNVWGRQSYRLSDLDFKAIARRLRRRLAISYADLAPYYDIVEDYVGISGQAEGVASCRTASSCRRCR